MAKKKQPPATGYMRLIYGEITISKDGKTRTFSGINIRKELRNGHWVEVPTPEGETGHAGNTGPRKARNVRDR